LDATTHACSLRGRARYNDQADALEVAGDAWEEAGFATNAEECRLRALELRGMTLRASG